MRTSFIIFAPTPASHVDGRLQTNGSVHSDATSASPGVQYSAPISMSPTAPHRRILPPRHETITEWQARVICEKESLGNWQVQAIRDGPEPRETITEWQARVICKKESLGNCRVQAIRDSPEPHSPVTAGGWPPLCDKVAHNESFDVDSFFV